MLFVFFALMAWIQGPEVTLLYTRDIITLRFLFRWIYRVRKNRSARKHEKELGGALDAVVEFMDDLDEEGSDDEL